MTIAKDIKLISECRKKYLWFEFIKLYHKCQGASTNVKKLLLNIAFSQINNQFQYNYLQGQLSKNFFVPMVG